MTTDPPFKVGDKVRDIIVQEALGEDDSTAMVETVRAVALMAGRWFVLTEEWPDTAFGADSFEKAE